MSRNRLRYTILLALCVVGFWVFDNFYTPSPYSDPNSTASPPFEEVLMPSTTYDAVVIHDFFMLSYSEPHEQAEWVAYRLEKAHLTYDDRERPYFVEDPKVKSKSADWRNFKGSGYDRGHLCPAGDRRFSEYAFNETFYTSNITPQKNAFNAGIWNRLEVQVRRWCRRYGTLYIITGGVLGDDLPKIGMEDVAVPKAFYKIVLRKSGNEYRAVAFLIPHQESIKPLSDFLIPVDELEKVTGLDFFYELNDASERKMEQEVDTSSWKF
ncbi:MAG: DNA/RNA non-specific endonuclease [Bacteroidota bacterium]